jgi:hypothetical protein
MSSRTITDMVWRKERAVLLLKMFVCLFVYYVSFLL